MDTNNVTLPIGFKPNPGFQPGQSGNPKGRPRKGQTITDALEREGTSSRRHALAITIWTQAIAGKESQQRIILDRLDGAVTKRLELSVADVGAQIRALAAALGLSAAEEAAALAEAQRIAPQLIEGRARIIEERPPDIAGV